MLNYEDMSGMMDVINSIKKDRVEKTIYGGEQREKESEISWKEERKKLCIYVSAKMFIYINMNVFS